MSFLDFLSHTLQSVKPAAARTVGDFKNFLENPEGGVSTKVGKTVGSPGFQQGVKDTAINVARSFPRDVASIGLSTHILPSDVTGEGVEQYNPTAPNHNSFSHFLLGDQPINGVTGEAEKVGSSVGLKGNANKVFGTVAGIPLAIAGLDVGAGGLGRAGALDALSKASTVEDVTKALNQVKGLKLTPDVVKSVAPQIAASTDKGEINSILTQAVQGVKKPTVSAVAQTVAAPLTDANRVVNENNTAKTVNKVLSGNAEHLRLDQPGPLQQAKDYAANKLPANADGSTTVTAYRAGNGTISAGEHVTLDPNKVKQYVAQRPGSQVSTVQVPLQDLVKSQGLKSEFVYAPKSAVFPAAEDSKNITTKLVDQAKTFGATPSASLESTLKDTNLATRPAKSFEWLNKIKDTQGVAANYLGKVGSDTVYHLSQGAKVVADIQEKTAPLIQESQKLLKSISKDNKVSSSEVQSRIYQALKDRNNAASYLKTPQEKKLYDIAQQVFDSFKSERESRGLGTLENYSPRTAVQDALDAPDRLLQGVRGGTSFNAESAFSKERKLAEGVNIDKNIIDVLPKYVSSQAREFGYKPALDYFKENIGNVNPTYLSDKHSAQVGTEYMQRLFQQVLNPEKASGLEKFINKRLQTTYKSALAFSPRFALQNLTQRFITDTLVSSKAIGTDAKTIAKAFTNDHRAELTKGLTSGKNTITSELGELDTGKAARDFSKFDPGQKVETGNVNDAFFRGAGQQILESPSYKKAVNQGLNKQEAISTALRDSQTKELAIRRGNVVVNQTQFGANIVNKPEFFREGGFVGLIPKKFLQQYQRFSAGMAENILSSFAPQQARELDILRRGNPTETSLVDYSRSTEALQNATKEVISGIKKGVITDVDLADAKSYMAQLSLAKKQLDAGIKNASQFRAGKNLKQAAKMWAAASAVQFLFNGGNPGKAVNSGAPINIPATGREPIPTATHDLPGAAIPALPQNNNQVLGKVLNFVPGVGTAYNRARDANQFFKTLKGGN